MPALLAAECESAGNRGQLAATAEPVFTKAVGEDATDSGDQGAAAGDKHRIDLLGTDLGSGQ